MTPFEKLKREFLLLALDEEFDLMSLISSVSGQFYYKNEKQIKKIIDEEVNEIIIDFIKYVFDKNLFFVSGDVNGIVLGNVSESKCLSIIKSILNKDESSLFWIVFNLTKEGIVEAKKYLQKSIHIKEKILISKKITFNSIMDLIKQEFNTNDFDEIKYEATYILSLLLHNQFIKGWSENNLLLSDNFLTRYDQIESEIENIKNNPELGEAFHFNNTPVTNALVEKWKQCGGRLVDKWYDLIDNR